MKIEKVTIHNFRSIIDSCFLLCDYTLLVGSNNAGKSACLDAIRYFFEADKDAKFDPDEDFPKRGANDGETWIEIAFKITDGELVSLKEDYQTSGNVLTLRKYLKADKKRQGYIFFKALDGTVADSPFYGAKNVQSGKIGNAIYIPAVSTVEDQAKLTGPSALRDMVADVFESAIHDSPAYASFKEHVSEFSDQISSLESVDKVSLKGIEEEFNAAIGHWGTKFVLQLKAPSGADMVKNMLAWNLTDDVLRMDNPPERYGTGFQRHFIYSLIKLKARFEARKNKNRIADKQKKDFTPDFSLLLFEEPEAFLHPQQQRELAKSLRAIGRDDTWQVLCTTHSPEFVSHNMSDLKTVIRLQKQGHESIVRQIGDREIQDIFADTFPPHQYPELAGKYNAKAHRDMQAVKFAIWLNPHRAGMFFADKVLLVEGPSEQALIERLMDEGEVGHSSGIFVLDCFGKYNLFRFMRLLGALGIYHSVLHDKDAAGNKEHVQWNQLTQDSRNEFTADIKAISPDLEGYLKVEKPKDSHQKPQELLWKYENNAIGQESLQRFIELIEPLLTIP